MHKEKNIRDKFSPVVLHVLMLQLAPRLIHENISIFLVWKEFIQLNLDSSIYTTLFSFIRLSDS